MINREKTLTRLFRLYFKSKTKYEQKDSYFKITKKESFVLAIQSSLNLHETLKLERILYRAWVVDYLLPGVVFTDITNL